MSSVGSWIGIVLLTIALIVVLVFVNRKGNRNSVTETEDLMIYPFAGFVSGSTTSSLNDLNGNPQITCPAGKKVNILGAFVEVYDPFLTCWPNGPTADYVNTCSSSPTGEWATSCSNNSNAAFQNKSCLPPSGVAAPASASSSTTGTIMCARRDASAWIASLCDGKSSCPLSPNPSTIGPLPCSTFNGSSMVALSPTEMGLLPLSPGVTATGANPTTEQGYNFHGIFVCR